MGLARQSAAALAEHADVTLDEGRFAPLPRTARTDATGAFAIPGVLPGRYVIAAVAPGYVPAPNEDVRVYRNYVSPGYFSLMRIPLAHGREFTDADRGDTPFVAIVNETFARRYLGGKRGGGGGFSGGGGGIGSSGGK
mgnify:CR=1 FL=1